MVGSEETFAYANNYYLSSISELIRKPKEMAMAAPEVENIPIITNITSFIIGVEEEIVNRSQFGFLVEGVLLVGISIC